MIRKYMLSAMLSFMFLASASTFADVTLIKDSYIVAFKDNAGVVVPATAANRMPGPIPFGQPSTGQSKSEVAAILGTTGEVVGVLDALNAVNIMMDATEAERLRQDKRVLRVTQSVMPSPHSAQNATAKPASAAAASPASTGGADISNARVFSYAEANYQNFFSGAATSGKYQIYDYRYYPATKNYLAVDTSGMVAILGPVSGGVIQNVGTVASFAKLITDWEAKQNPTCTLPQVLTNGVCATPTATVAALTLTSSAFADSQPIPVKYSYSLTNQCAGANYSPSLAWRNTPSGTNSFAISVVDPDGGNWLHWIQFNIPASASGLAEEINGSAVGIKGANDFGINGYGGPCPPSGTGVHRYVFTLYALDTTLSLQQGATLDQVNAAMSGHILAQTTLTGLKAY